MISNQPDGAIAATNEEALALIHSVLEASTEYAIVATDMDRIVVLWNEGARRLYGYESVEAVGKLNISEIYLSEDIANGRMREMFDGALRDGRWSGPVRKRRKNDEQVVVRAMITQRLDASSTTIGYLLISRDMSDELRLAAELETTNRELRAQMTQRQKAEADLSQAHQEEILRTRTLEQVSSQLKLLAEMSDLLQSCADSDEARQVTQRSLEKFFPNESGVIYLNQLIGSSLQTFVSWNNANLMSKENFEPNECWALRRGRPHVISPDNAAIRCAHFHNKQEGGSICVPMSGQGQPLGIFHLAWTENESAQDGSRDRKRLAEMVADTIALAVSNVRLREALKDQTIRDPLTRLYNRRYLDDSLNREVSRARRAKTTIGIIMIDLDNFKHSNDTFGHPTGDHLLRSFGAYLKALVRPEDIPSPFGGEEFALILPGASRHIVLERAEKLRKGFQNMPMEHGLGVGNAVDTLSLSCGVAIFPDDKPSNRTGNRCSMPNVR